VVEIVLQRAGPGRYASKLLYDRFQIMELGVTAGEFKIVDLTKLDDSYMADWKAVLRHPAKGEGFGDPIVFTTVAEAETFVKQLATGEKPMPTSKKGKEPPVPKVKAEKKPSMAGMARDLILAGKLTDDQIFQQVLEAFPNFRRTSVDWYRNELIKKGQLKT